jgi:uncharacterized protein
LMPDFLIISARHPMKYPLGLTRSLLVAFGFLMIGAAYAAPLKPAFKVIAFFTGKSDRAHISFVAESVKWFPEMGQRYHFLCDTTSNWDNMNSEFLSRYQVVVFLDTRPEKPAQRRAFQEFIENGGGWMGFHFSAFALTPSHYAQDWDWYHNVFLGSGQYKSNTWKPAMRNLPITFKSAPNEWYRWENDLKANPDIEVLVSIDPLSFPLGTGPKQHEIWHSGYYPVVWSNKKYRMIYLNMGHNDIDYENRTNKTLSFTLQNEKQNKIIINGLLWLGKGNNKKRR